MSFAETVCAGAQHPGTEPEVLSTPAGYYIGYRDEDGLPYSRETNYFATESEAEGCLEIFKAAMSCNPSFARFLSFVRGC